MMSDPEFYREDGARIAAMKAALNDVERGLAEAYTRWETLESRNKA